jgi:hypothetical protein
MYPNIPHLVTVKRLADLCPDLFPQPRTRDLIYHSEPRISAQGETIPPNGFASCIVRAAGCVLIDLTQCRCGSNGAVPSVIGSQTRTSMTSSEREVRGGCGCPWNEQNETQPAVNLADLCTQPQFRSHAPSSWVVSADLLLLSD